MPLVESRGWLLPTLTRARIFQRTSELGAHMSVREESSPRLIQIEGTFDLAAARRVAEAVVAARPGERLEVDLTGVREFHDFGVAVLAQALASGRAHTSVRGLRQHHVRLLRYFGIDARAADVAENDA
jgi:anti-anti-sigma regulatory factor